MVIIRLFKLETFPPKIHMRFEGPGAGATDVFTQGKYTYCNGDNKARAYLMVDF